MGATALTDLEKLAELIESVEAYSCEIADDVLLITRLATGSQFVGEIFDGSVQIRQAVFFDGADIDS